MQGVTARHPSPLFDTHGGVNMAGTPGASLRFLGTLILSDA